MAAISDFDEIRKTAKALTAFACHSTDCPARRRKIAPCDCGFGALLKYKPDGPLADDVAIVLLGYAEHRRGCPARTDDDEDCNCGLDELTASVPDGRWDQAADRLGIAPVRRGR